MQNTVIHKIILGILGSTGSTGREIRNANRDIKNRNEINQHVSLGSARVYIIDHLQWNSVVVHFDEVPVRILLVIIDIYSSCHRSKKQERSILADSLLSPCLCPKNFLPNYWYNLMPDFGMIGTLGSSPRVFFPVLLGAQLLSLTYRILPSNPQEFQTAEDTHCDIEFFAFVTIWVRKGH